MDTLKKGDTQRKGQIILWYLYQIEDIGKREGHMEDTKIEWHSGFVAAISLE